MFIPASALLAMHSIYIGQLLRPAAAHVPMFLEGKFSMGTCALCLHYIFSDCELNI